MPGLRDSRHLAETQRLSPVVETSAVAISRSAPRDACVDHLVDSHQCQNATYRLVISSGNGGD